MPTIGQVVNVMREAVVDALVMPWVNARVAHVLAVWRMVPMEVGDGQEEKFDANDDDLLMYTQKTENFRTLLFPCNTSKDREDLYGRTY